MKTKQGTFYIMGMIVFLPILILSIVGLVMAKAYLEVFAIVYILLTIYRLFSADKVSWDDSVLKINDTMIPLCNISHIDFDCSPYSVFIRGFYNVNCKISIYTSDGMFFSSKLYDYFVMNALCGYLKDKVRNCKLPFCFSFYLFNILFWVSLLSPAFTFKSFGL